METDNKKEKTEQNKTKGLKKKTLKVKKRVVVPAIAFAVMALGGIYMLLHGHYYQVTDDAFIEGHIVSVAPRVSGPVVRLYIKDNQEVKKGDLLLEIDPADYEVTLKQKEAKLLEARASLNLSDKTINESKTVSRQTGEDISSVKSKLDYAKRAYERDKMLQNKGIVSTQEYEASRAQYNSLSANHNAELEKKRAADIKVQGALAKKQEVVAQIKRLESEIEEAKLNLSYTKVYAPQDGRISSRTVEQGNFVQVAQPLMSIVSDEVWIVANYKETQLEQVKDGQEVIIKIDTYSKKKFKGKVDSIQRSTGAKASLFPPENAVGSYVKIVQRIPVKIIFDEDISGYNIAPGMSVVPKIKIR